MNHTAFAPDLNTSTDPNLRLADLLKTIWLNIRIIRINRVTQNSQVGWLVTFEN